ncbi:putative disease resistance RPP13-like protein 1 [Ananas comosus]|uniref:Disease resistance RPP13-like protein 1 n=1 Tax=Ananas comosus TaxID=4615 RepID=A0A6P5FLI9_ANACO|nr:putative disease resistance RPP13-like protein 1 [Ananas comosus]
MVAVESIVLAALGWVASPLMTKLLNEGFASVGVDAERKLEEMEKYIVPVMKAVTEEAEGSPHRSEVEGWLLRMKDAYEDAEDALDLLRYHRLRREAEAASSSTRRRIYQLRSSFQESRRMRWVVPVFEGGRDMLSPQKIKLKHRLNKLEKIANQVEKLRAQLGAQPDRTVAPDSRRTISLPPQKVFGRDEDRKEIIRLLKIEPAAGIPIIAIVGRPGVGKTTLAQYVCEQLRSELAGDGRHFDLIVWVHASRNLDTSEIMKKIIQQASTASEPQDPVNPDDVPGMIHAYLRNLDTMVVGDLDWPEELRLKMSTKLNSKMFLLVIDDVWCDGEDHKNNWDALFRCLSRCCCLLGSKILVTSQTDDAPRKIGAAGENIYRLEELREDGFLDLFIHYALPSRGMDSSVREDLEEKCRTIAKKLNKDATAAEIVGETIGMKAAELLRSRDYLRKYLRTIAEKDWSDSQTRALMWSYQHMPAHLQLCFSYCSLYPKGYKFKALELVQLWMAQGFIKPDDQNERMEDVGNDYLEKLVSRFYIHQSHDGYYTLHELLYSLATKVSSGVCLRMEGKKEKIPSTIRHLRIPADKLNENKEEICKLKKLRTLIVAKGESAPSEEENIATGVFNSLQKLRVLVLELNLENLAEFIGEMKHLRVLQVSGTSEFVLLESVSTLFQLEVLEVENASSPPKFLNNLVSLRYLRPPGIADIGKLTSLQGLEYFQVRKERGCELEQLQNLNELRGCLRIDNLENVESKESAIAANLKEKKHLDTLQLVWRDGADSVNSTMDAEILEGLQLPPNLTSLHLDGYRGGRLWPSWPENQTSNVEVLALRRCGMLEELPPMDQLYPSCRSLELSHLSRLKALHTLPPRLRKIAIFRAPFLTFVTKEDLQMRPADKRSIIKDTRKRMPKWFPHQHQESLVRNEREMRNFIAATNGSDSNEASSRKHDERVPAADADITAVRERWLEMHERKMELIYSRRNEAKLLLPSTLTMLWLEGCNITNHALSACLQTLTSLTRLSLVDIRTITRLPSVDAVAKLKALQTLRLRDCWALTSLGGIRSLPRLEDLILIGCPCLAGETASLPSSLRSIHSESCANVDAILTNADLPRLSRLMITRCRMRAALLKFGNLRSLRSLIIEHCPGLSSLADVQKLRSLKFLILHNCSNLQEVMNLPGSLKSLGIRGCPILEAQSVDVDPRSRVRMLGGIPVEDNFETCSVM